MTEDKRPIISIGLLTAPVVIPNFTTDEEGRNLIAEQLLNTFVTVLEETWDKLHEFAQQTLANVGVEIQIVPKETLNEIILQAISKGQGDIMHGVLTQKGKVILDEQAAEQLRKGISIDN